MIKDYSGHIIGLIISLIFLISIVAIADISAFFVGKKYGKKSFFNTISPNKTQEGFIGSIIICLFSAWGILFICQL